ncbi:MAG TPA: type 1 glutamine amidotransferase [Puia sp.]|nr:type 1 glutamine amidotransferase [Puia sp.]
MIKIHCLQHAPFETPGNIEAWIKQKGHSISCTHLYNQEGLPEQNDFDALIIMGGPMSIHDEKEFPWLKKEKEFIKTAIDKNKKILGICLGSQLLADAFGAKVYANKEKEIGFMPVCFTKDALQQSWFDGFSECETVFHWHGETFDLPHNATLLAQTDVCQNQAYMVGTHVLAIQFHLELTREIVKNMIAHEGHELVSANNIHSANKIAGELSYLERNKKLLFGLLDKFI